MAALRHRLSAAYRLSRLITGTKAVPADRLARDRVGTWGWLRGRHLWQPDQPLKLTAFPADPPPLPPARVRLGVDIAADGVSTPTVSFCPECGEPQDGTVEWHLLDDAGIRPGERINVIRDAQHVRIHYSCRNGHVQVMAVEPPNQAHDTFRIFPAPHTDDQTGTTP